VWACADGISRRSRTFYYWGAILWVGYKKPKADVPLVVYVVCGGWASSSSKLISSLGGAGYYYWFGYVCFSFFGDDEDSSSSELEELEELCFLFFLCFLLFFFFDFFSSPIPLNNSFWGESFLTVAYYYYAYFYYSLYQTLVVGFANFKFWSSSKGLYYYCGYVVTGAG